MPVKPSNSSRFLVDMKPRDPGEPHRAATPLELLYDLVFVVAIALAASELHHAVAHGHGISGTGCYLMVFFAIWWAWMNFTWFASAFDNDDALYRVCVFVQMVGVVVLASGIPKAFSELDLTLLVVGYVIMRIALVSQWLRAGKASETHRKSALRYAIGIAICQVGWIGILFVPEAIRWPVFGMLIVAELVVPVWGEAAARTPWHRHHIAERFGLMTIITIGESVLASTLAMQSVVKKGSPGLAMWIAIATIPPIFFSMWWLYFARPHHRLLDSTRNAFIWGYTHFVVFASAAAVGAAFALIVDQLTDHTDIGDWQAGMALVLPLAAYLLSLWFVRVRCDADNRLLPRLYLGISGVALILPAIAPLALTLVLLALLLIGLVGIQVASNPMEPPRTRTA